MTKEEIKQDKLNIKDKLDIEIQKNIEEFLLYAKKIKS